MYVHAWGVALWISYSNYDLFPENTAFFIILKRLKINHKIILISGGLAAGDVACSLFPCASHLLSSLG